MRRLASLFCAAAMLTSAAAFAQSAEVPDGARTIEFELREGDRLIAAPSLRVQVGRPAAISLGDYSLRLRMDRAVVADGEAAAFVIRSSLYRSEGGLVASPSVTLGEGIEARLRFAGSDGTRLSLAVIVR